MFCLFEGVQTKGFRRTLITMDESFNEAEFNEYLRTILCLWDNSKALCLPIM